MLELALSLSLLSHVTCVASWNSQPLFLTGATEFVDISLQESSELKLAITVHYWALTIPHCATEFVVISHQVSSKLEVVITVHYWDFTIPHCATEFVVISLLMSTGSNLDLKSTFYLTW